MEDKVSKEESLASPFCLGREWIGKHGDPDAANKIWLVLGHNLFNFISAKGQNP